jgi:Holliday junction DNA helicase RuvA
MIGKLTGTISDIYKNHLIIDVSGVGYIVSTPTRTLSKFASKGKKISLFIHTFVREDALMLYGFETPEELALFEKLLSIAGIGGKIALSVISAGSIEEIRKAVLNNDVDFFTKISGIGKKSAHRLIVDLKGVLGEPADLTLLEATSETYEEAVKALRQFGFSAREARDALSNIKDKHKLETGQLLKEALKVIGTK